MKKTIKLAVVAALALGTTSVFATNGSTLIGVGAKARGMGGVGIGMSHGAESALANPAMITSVKNTEVAFGGTIFMPNVKNENSLNFGPGGDFSSAATSQADMSVIPSVSIASKINNNLYIGVGMWGTAGMGVDYRDAANSGQFNMVTNLQIMQFGVPIAYKVDGLSLAVTPVLQYGALDINYNNMGTQVGAGVAQDLQFGYNLGAAYEVDGFTVGATYKSQIDMEYKGQISGAMGGFGVPNPNDKLSTPEEMGVGVSYNTNEHTFAVDYKRINWSKAKGYEDFQWEDQDVYALGYEYATTGWAARVGYNYSKSPIREQTMGSMGATGGGADMAGLINTFNLLGFPATVESHYTLGGTYNVNETTSFDLAFAYAPEVSNTYSHFAGQPMTTKHSQQSISAGVNFAF
jgi:long-chain fatty acid transport protein